MTLPDGWLTDKEADELSRLARGATVLELGAWKGRSTVVMAEVAHLVVSVDKHKGIPGAYKGEKPSLGAYMENVAPYDNIIPIVADWNLIVPLLIPGSFDLIFLDGNHDEESVSADLVLIECLLTNGTVVAAHDWDIEGVSEGAKGAGYGTPDRVVGSVAVWTWRNR